MKNKKIQTLKGFRDFLPEEKRKRDYVMSKIIQTFQLYGFEPVETPGLEYADLLLGKYGDEADKLVYNFQDRGGRQVALPYDQTVPTARVLAQYQGSLPKIFKRYSIKNVFRADKPQKGRFREFTQCDIDIFGTQNPTSDAEIIACTYDAIKNIGFDQVIIKVNDRQVLLNTLKPYEIEGKVDVYSIIQSIDKLDKLPSEKVTQELVSKGLTQENAQQALKDIRSAIKSDNLQQIITTATQLGTPQKAIQFEPTLARGLDYYTGIIFEIIIPSYPVGSVGGGGRYDNLINQLGGIDVPAVGLAFGFDRLVEAATQLDLIPSNNLGSQVLVINPENNQINAYQTANKLRQAGISTELYAEPAKLGKQFKYANKKSISWVVVIAEEEIKQDKITLKNMESGEQQLTTINESIKIISQN